MIETKDNNITHNDENNGQHNYSKPLISVIIPVYNVEKYLSKCLNSIVDQTYTNLQIILVNDGSTDGSLAIAQTFAEKDERVRIINQRNKGLPGARNSGIEAAEGDYIGFVDSDDWVHPQFYEHLYRNMVTYKADLSEIGFIRASNDQEKVNLYNPKVTVYDNHDYAKRFFKIGIQKTTHYAWNKLYKRDCIESTIFPEKYSVGEDVISTYKVITKCDRIVVSDLPLYFYRQGSGMTKAFNRKYFQLIDIWDDICTNAREDNPEYYDWAKLNRQRISFTILSQLATSGDNKNPEYADVKKQLLSDLRASLKDLVKSKIALSRKVLMCLYCIDYKHSAMLVRLFAKREQ